MTRFSGSVTPCVSTISWPSCQSWITPSSLCESRKCAFTSTHCPSGNTIGLSLSRAADENLPPNAMCKLAMHCIISSKRRLEFKLNFPFNAVLCNYYRNGADSMGWHSDNEPEIDQMMIASVSFGETRRFGVRERSSRATQSFNLQHGSLLIMENFQKDWQHCIPTSKRPMNPRLNLTFRHIIAPKKPSMP